MSWFENHFNWVLWVLFFHVIDTVLRKLRITSLLQRNFQLLIQIFLAEMTKTSELKAIWKRLLLVLLEVCSMFSSCVPFCRKSWKLRAKKEVEYHSRLVHIPYFSHYYSGFPTFRAVLTLLQYVQTLKKMWWESPRWNILHILLQSIIVKCLWFLLLLIIWFLADH